MASSLLLACLFSAALWTISESCRVEEMVRGCRVRDGQCVCSIGCRAEFKFPNRDLCKASLKSKTGSKSKDSCSGTPCANQGICTQVSSALNQSYRCRCEGTGYYGPRCQYACPTLGDGGVKVFPYECIII